MKIENSSPKLPKEKLTIREIGYGVPFIFDKIEHPFSMDYIFMKVDARMVTEIKSNTEDSFLVDLQNGRIYNSDPENFITKIDAVIKIK